MKNLKISDDAHYKLKAYCDLNNLKMNDWVSDKIIHLIKNYTYVEISPRGSGKTTRLIQAIKNYICGELKGLPVVVVTPNKNTTKIIKDKLIEVGVDINQITFSNTMCILYGSAKANSCYKYFIDEFDYIDRDKLFISNTGYYCGTLKDSEGDEFTKKLYQTYINSTLWKK